jgi:zinc transport system substrate-binding protein
MSDLIRKTLFQRRPRHARLAGLLALVASVLVSAPSMAEMVVYTVNYPLAYFAERIGGDSVTVRFPAPSEVDPAFWKPDPEIIAGYQSADLILLNGAGYAGWVGQTSLPRRKLVDTSRSFRDAYLPGEETPVHQHGPAGEHAHGKVAFTTWLDPQQAIAQARAVESAFAKRDAEDAPDFARRADALVADLEQLDRDLAVAFSAIRGEFLLASHPVYAYLARRYGLDLRALTWEPDLAPDETDWKTLDASLAKHSARWMLWEAEPIDATRKQLEERGIAVLVFEVASNRPTQGDFLVTMRANVETLDLAPRQTLPLTQR